MNSLYFNQMTSVVISALTILIMLIALLVIAQGASFLTLTIERNLDPIVFVSFLFHLVPAQVTNLLPICLLIGSATTLNTISNAGEFSILRAAGISEASYFRPMLLIGFVFAIAQLLFAAEITPTSLSNLASLQSQAKAQIAQNTTINAAEPVFFGDTTLFAGKTGAGDLQTILIYQTPAQETDVYLLSAQSAAFETQGLDLFLSLRNGGGLRLDANGTPLSVQSFAENQQNLSALLPDSGRKSNSRVSAALPLRTLLAAPLGKGDLAHEYRAEAAKRLAYVLIVFAIPSWLMFWQLMFAQARTGGWPLKLLGPVSLIVLILFIEAYRLTFAAFNAATIMLYACLLAIAFAGPIYFSLRGAQKIGAIQFLTPGRQAT